MNNSQDDISEELNIFLYENCIYCKKLILKSNIKKHIEYSCNSIPLIVMSDSIYDNISFVITKIYNNIFYPKCSICQTDGHTKISCNRKN